MKGITPEMMEKAKNAKNAEELLALAKENNVEMTAEEATAFFAKLNPTCGELSDDELEDVAGGGCGEYHYCPVCGAEPLWSSNGDGGVIIRCPGCDAILDHDTDTGVYTVKQ